VLEAQVGVQNFAAFDEELADSGSASLKGGVWIRRSKHVGQRVVGRCWAMEGLLQALSERRRRAQGKSREIGKL